MNKLFSLFTLFLCLGCARAQDAAPLDALPEGQNSISILFDKEPVENGLTFSRKGVSATTLTIGDEKYPAWVAKSSIEPSMGWTRSFRFKVTDPKFQKGGRPAVDVEIVYFSKADAGWTIKADTKAGATRVASGWGKAKAWKTAKFRIDDAFFGARSRGGDEKMSLDGFDLRMDANNEPLYLRSIVITGYDPTKNVDWGRLLKTNDIETDVPGNIFMFRRAAKNQVRVPVQNMAQLARPLFYRFEVSDYEDKLRENDEGTVTVKPDATQNVALDFDTSKWPLGPYDAKLSLYLDKADKTPVYSREWKMGVISDAALPKARAGEFLFGLDAANSYVYRTHTPSAFAFYRLMGVDILRSVSDNGNNDKPDQVGADLESLKAENLQAMLMMDPPKDPSAAKRDAALGRVARNLEEIAARYAGRGPGQLRYFELGNEPDLPFFYPGPVSDYARAFETMRAAVKRGAARKGLKDDDTVVMNGGLSFAGPTGDARSREFLQVVDGAQLDAIAYHGHGKGGESERMALERVREAAAKAGIVDVKFIETESGFSGNDRNGLMEQARTAVEKLTYAQTQNLETFMFFRLMMEGSGSEGGYGLTENKVEPRPSVLSYRNLVERLRHHRFVKAVDFAGALGAPGLRAYLFEERDAKGAATGQKTLVAWSESPAQFDLSLRLDAPKVAVTRAREFDIWGNAAPARVLAGNVASVTVGVEPKFVEWNSSGAATLAQVAPSLLTVRADEPLPVGATTRFAVLARNPAEAAQRARLRVESFARVPVEASVSPAQIELRGDGEAVAAQLSVKVAPSDLPLAMPTWWKVFVDVDRDRAAELALQNVPAEVTGQSGQWQSSQSFAGGQRLEFAGLAGGFGEKRAALAVTTINAPRAISLPVAASADWWMQWRVNGAPVYSTLDKGNQHGGLADRTFELPLRAGQNVISALVLSGSGGWKLEFGGPKERALALSAGTDPDRAVISLVAADGKTLATQVVPLQLEAPVALVAKAPQSLDEWMPLQPTAVLGEAEVTNFWVTEPEPSRWYKGADDLSALVWLRESGDNLLLYVAARDDKLVEAKNAAELDKADHLKLTLRDESGVTLLDTLVGSSGGKALATRGADARVTRADGRTLYALTIPKKLVGAAPFRVALELGDNDAGYLKQSQRWGGEKGAKLIVR